MPTDDAVEAVDQYCSSLRKTLRGAPSPERDEIVAEVRSHILERLDAETEVSDEGLARILRAVGDPRELASEYRTQQMLRLAVRSRSPWLLLRATLRWARTGLVGLTVFLATVVGYGCAVTFLLCALLKPVFPSRIGLWLAPQQTLGVGYWNGRIEGAEIYGISVRPPFSFVLGTLGSTDGPVHELMGVWLIPVAIVCGLLLFAATTLFARWVIGRYGWQSPARVLATSTRRPGAAAQDTEGPA